MTALERLTLLLRHEACWESCSLLPRLALSQQEFYQRTLDSLGRDVGMKPNRSHGERRIRVGFRASKGELQAFMLIDTRISLDSNPTKYQQSIECSEHTKPRICGTSARAPPGRPRTLRSALRALPCPGSPVPPAARAASS